MQSLNLGIFADVSQLPSMSLCCAVLPPGCNDLQDETAMSYCKTRKAVTVVLK